MATGNSMKSIARIFYRSACACEGPRGGGGGAGSIRFGGDKEILASRQIHQYRMHEGGGVFQKNEGGSGESKVQRHGEKWQSQKAQKVLEGRGQLPRPRLSISPRLPSKFCLLVFDHPAWGPLSLGK